MPAALLHSTSMFAMLIYHVPIIYISCAHQSLYRMLLPPGLFAAVSAAWSSDLVLVIGDDG